MRPGPPGLFVRSIAELPVGLPRGTFAPGVVATVAALMGASRLSQCVAVDQLGDLASLSTSLESVIRCQREAPSALTAPHHRGPVAQPA